MEDAFGRPWISNPAPRVFSRSKSSNFDLNDPLDVRISDARTETEIDAGEETGDLKSACDADNEDEDEDDEPVPYGTLDKLDVFDMASTVRDPEHMQHTLGDLRVITKRSVVFVKDQPDKDCCTVILSFRPTVAHCHLASTIGLCLFQRLHEQIPRKSLKIHVSVAEGSHLEVEEVTKQINDKERRAAALEGPEVAELVRKCCLDRD